MTSESDSSFDAMLRDAAALRVPDAELRPPVQGELLQGKYRIEEPLGAGGMGLVFRATNVENDKPVAIKWLRTSSAKARARFEREGKIAAQIAHPNVVNVFDVGSHCGATFLVMELLLGATLRDRLRQDTMAPRELVPLMLGVLRGVRAAHAAGVIHRDLKPANVFLCVASDGSVSEPKLLDFGISKLRSEAQQDEHLTDEGALLGTLAYMSPEQRVDAMHVDERTDVYAMGAIMYEALVGAPPFSPATYATTDLAIAAREPRPIRALTRAVDAELERIVMRALASAASDRYPSADALIQALLGWSGANAQRAEERGARAVVAPARGLRRVVGAMLLASLCAALGWAVGAWPRPSVVGRATLRPPSAPRASVAEAKPADPALTQLRATHVSQPVVAVSASAPLPAVRAPVAGKRTPELVRVAPPAGGLRRSELW